MQLDYVILVTAPCHRKQLWREVDRLLYFFFVQNKPRHCRCTVYSLNSWRSRSGFYRYYWKDITRIDLYSVKYFFLAWGDFVLMGSVSRLTAYHLIPLHLGIHEKRKSDFQAERELSMTRLCLGEPNETSSEQTHGSFQSLDGASWKKEVRTHQHHLCLTSHCSVGWCETSEPTGATGKTDRRKDLLASIMSI